MKSLLITLVFFMSAIAGFSQKYFTKNGNVKFDVTSPSSPEKINAVNAQTTCVIDTKTGAIQFLSLVKGFQFERALMEEHFNENYMESDKFPKAEFRGSISNNNLVGYAKDGTYNVKVNGKLTMHGVTNDVETDGKLVIQNGKISATAIFNVSLSDYKINIPSLVADKVSKTAQINVSCSLEPFKN